MMRINEIVLFGRLLLAAIMGSFIGLEREAHGHPAGLRTHTLVAVGSCLVMLISIYAFESSVNHDPARLAAQVVSGIGFLGAGTILREGVTIRGLTTAATLWVVAGIGLAVGSGFYLGAVATTLISVFTLIVLNRIEKRYLDPKAVRVKATLQDRPGQLAEFCKVFAKYGVSIKDINLDVDEENERAIISLHLKGYNIPKEEIISDLHLIAGVSHIEWK